jgi:hypothetical protein
MYTIHMFIFTGMRKTSTCPLASRFIRIPFAEEEEIHLVLTICSWILKLSISLCSDGYVNVTSVEVSIFIFHFSTLYQDT